MTWWLNSSLVTYAVPEEEALEESFILRFSKVKAKEGQIANNQSVRVKKLSAVAMVCRKESAKTAGHDL